MRSKIREKTNKSITNNGNFCVFHKYVEILALSRLTVFSGSAAPFFLVLIFSFIFCNSKHPLIIGIAKAIIIGIIVVQMVSLISLILSNHLENKNNPHPVGFREFLEIVPLLFKPVGVFWGILMPIFLLVIIILLTLTMPEITAVTDKIALVIMSYQTVTFILYTLYPTYKKYKRNHNNIIKK